MTLTARNFDTTFPDLMADVISLGLATQFNARLTSWSGR